MEKDEVPFTLKESLFNADRFRHVADETKAVYPDFDKKKFLALTLPAIPPLSLMQRLDLMATALQATLPPDYRAALKILRNLAPRINSGFVALVLPRFVALYGVDDVAVSLEALRFFTPFGSSEFAIREFLRRDLAGTLTVMREWSSDADEHVRRLASEGCRPRLPWSFRLEKLVADPTPVLPILENLRSDPALYVRKSVANHLNDITKDHPALVMTLLEGWPRDDKHTAWIVKRALRTLIKQGDRRALALIGAGEKPRVRIEDFRVSPATVKLGGHATVAFTLVSTAKKPQRVIVDYCVHYVKKSGGTAEKVFKLKELLLAPGESVALSVKRALRDFTTRVHHAGVHRVELAVNGERLAEGAFTLIR